MDVRAVVIQPNNEIEARTFHSTPQYKEALDGSWLEFPLACGVMLVSDEFVLRESDINIIATRLLQMVGLVQPDTWVFGPAIVVGLPDCDGYDTNIPQKLNSLIRLIEDGVKAQNARV